MFQKRRPGVKKMTMMKSRSVGRKPGSLKKRFVPSKLPAVLRSSGSEIKAVDIPSFLAAFSVVATPPALYLLNPVQLGAGFYNRVGSKIELKSVHLRGNIRQTLTTTEGSLRLIVVYDRQPNGTAPALTDILQTRSQTGAATTTSFSEINLDQRDRYVMIRDKTWHAPSATYTAGVQTNGPSYPGTDEEFDINLFIPLNNLVTHYKSTTDPISVADINTGGLYMFCIASASVVEASYTASIAVRLRFGDK